MIMKNLQINHFYDRHQNLCVLYRIRTHIWSKNHSFDENGSTVQLKFIQKQNSMRSFVVKKNATPFGDFGTNALGCISFICFTRSPKSLEL